MTWPQQRVGKSPWPQLNAGAPCLLPRPQPKVHCSESAAIRGGLMPSGPKRIMPQGSRSSTLHVPDSPDLLQQIWAKFQQVLLGSSQNMHSDIIRAGWLVCGDRGTIKANRERAGPGWSHHTSLLPGIVRRNSSSTSSAKQTVKLVSNDPVAGNKVFPAHTLRIF